MRTITPEPFIVYSYSELDEEAKEKAREEMLRDLSEMGEVTNLIRQVAADWLTNNGWTGLADLRDSDRSDLEKLQFSIGHTQSDFVMWCSTKPYGGLLPEGDVVVQTEMHRNGYITITMTDPEYDGSDLHDRIENQLRDLVRMQQVRLLSRLHAFDLSLTDPDGYVADYLSDDVREIEFLADGTIYRG